MLPHQLITLQHAFSTYAVLSPPDLAAILPQFQVRRLAKQEVLLAAGDTCTFWGFVHRGLVRVYTDTAQGSEHTSWFIQAGDFVTEYASFYYQRPSLENMVALQETELLYVDHARLHLLYEQVPAFERLGRLLYERQLADLKQRLLFRLRYAAPDRYQHLLTHYPALVQQVPLKLLASYLGVTDSSLSRIRRRASQQASTAGPS